ncbi:MAG: hypothetical protein ACFE9Z_07490 [Promethearchaeota archaeon]
MKRERITAFRSTPLRKNNTGELFIKIDPEDYHSVFLINGNQFITKNISESDFIIEPNSYYMIINNDDNVLNIQYSNNISQNRVIYNPYKYEFSERVNLEEKYFKTRYKIPNGYIDVLPKWYSFKFSYPNYNLIFLQSEFGLSIQIHKHREEYWEILKGKPIIINGDKVHYYVEKGEKFKNPVNVYHSVINPHKNRDHYVLIRESWKGKFNEFDIERVFNPNNYK